jgi:hypothetical protein
LVLTSIFDRCNDREVVPGRPARALVGATPDTRLSVGANQKLSTTVTEPSPGEVLIYHHKKVVLPIEPGLTPRLRGDTIDLEPTNDARRAPILL